jgi:hypothetical protein
MSAIASSSRRQAADQLHSWWTRDSDSCSGATIEAVQTRRIDCDPSWKSKISDKNLVLIYIVYFWCYCTGTGKYRAAGIRCWSQIPEGTVSKEPRYGKDGPQMKHVIKEGNWQASNFGNLGRGYFHFCSSAWLKLGCYGLGSTSVTIVAHFLLL